MIPKIAVDAARSSYGAGLWWDHEVPSPPTYVTNRIQGSNPAAVAAFNRLLAAGKIVWTVEFRCPSAAFSQTFTFTDATFKLPFSEPAYKHLPRNDAFLVCGLAAAEPVTLPLDGALPIFHGGTPRAERGQWLCDDLQYHELQPALLSLLTWTADPELADSGRMRITADVPLRFRVAVPPAVHEQIDRRRDLQLAALTAALTLMHPKALSSHQERSESNGSEPPSEELAFFQRHGIPLGDESRPFDPLDAATRVEGVTLNLPRTDPDDD